MFQFRVHVLFQYLAFSHSQDSRNLIKKVTSHLFCRKVVLAVVQWTWKLGRGQNVIFCQIFKRCLGQLHVQVITELWCHLFLRLVYFKLMLHDLCCWLLIYHLSVPDFLFFKKFSRILKSMYFTFMLHDSRFWLCYLLLKYEWFLSNTPYTMVFKFENVGENWIQACTSISLDISHWMHNNLLFKVTFNHIAFQHNNTTDDKSCVNWTPVDLSIRFPPSIEFGLLCWWDKY